ncbi:MAG: transposase, partial [Sphaerochaetaceae bacterium]|nr:transposase [Sphaerochaetaceae bacterium]
TAREIFRRHPKIKRDILWGGALWTSGYYANTVGLYAGKETIRRYIENQGRQEEYTQLYSSQIELDFNP